MTGKEALQEWIDHYQIDCHKYCGDSFLEKLKIIEEDLDELTELREEVNEFDFRADMLCARNDELEQKLDKYKRAFEIFKRLLNDQFTYGGFDDGTLLIDGHIDITDEEKELLEELMNDVQ